jgi:signal transduction histidine kinase
VSEDETPWLVALGAGGEVIAAERGAPASWRGARLDEQADVPASLRQRAAATLRAWRAAPEEMTETVVDVPELSRQVKLVVLPAVGIRRIKTDVRALLAYAMAALERQAHALDVSLTVDTAADVPSALVLDPEKTAWAVTALVGNSLRHVKRGTRFRPGGAIEIVTRFDGDARELVIEVADDGPGMPEAVRLGLFVRAPGAPHATGLALTVVRDVVSAHGGTLEVRSSMDPDEHGTRVTVRLPAG